MELPLSVIAIILVALAFDLLSVRDLMWLALAAYATYVINATQFLLKLRAARLQQARESAAAPGGPAPMGQAETAL